MGYPALTRWQCARCFSTFEICNPYLVRPEPIVSLFKSRMDEHVCSQWINIIGWIGFLGRFGSITSQVCVFLAGHDYCLVLQRQKIMFFFPPKWCWFSCQSHCLAGEFTNLAQKWSVFPIPLTLFQCQMTSMLACLQIHLLTRFFFFSLQAAFFRFLFCIFPSAQICHKLKFCNILTPNKKQTNNKAGKTKKKQR